MQRPYPYIAAGVVLAAFAVSLAMARPAAGQSSQPTPPNLLAAIVDLAAAINAKLDVLIEQNESDTLVTPPVLASDFACNALNQSAGPIVVNSRMVSNTGSDINFVTVTIPPGRTDSLTAGLGAGNSVPVHCVFTVLNGTVADVRASITSSNGASLAAE